MPRMTAPTTVPVIRPTLARERGAADDGGGDGVELEGDADAGRAGRGIGRRLSSGLGSARSWLRRFPDTSLESLP